jgi:hypothetical protein
MNRAKATKVLHRKGIIATCRVRAPAHDVLLLESDTFARS